MIDGFSKKEKFRIPRIVKRYTKIVDHIINKLWKDNVHFTYMYDRIFPGTEEEFIFSKDDLQTD